MLILGVYFVSCFLKLTGKNRFTVIHPTIICPTRNFADQSLVYVTIFLYILKLPLLKYIVVPSFLISSHNRRLKWCDNNLHRSVNIPKNTHSDQI